jgi:hypothetical protein
MQITIEPGLGRRAKARAEKLGISFAEYIRRLLSQDLGEPKRNVDISSIIGLGDSGGSNISRDKDKLVGEAFASLKLKKRARK